MKNLISERRLRGLSSLILAAVLAMPSPGLAQHRRDRGIDDEVDVEKYEQLYKEAKDQLTSSLGALNQTKSELEEARKKLRNKRQKINDLKSQSEMNAQKILSNEIEIDQIAADIAQHETAIPGKEARIAALDPEIAGFKNQIAPVQSGINRIKRDISQAGSGPQDRDIQKLERQLANKTNALNEDKARASELSDELTSKKMKLAEDEAQLATAPPGSAEYVFLRHNIAYLKNRIEHLKSQVSAAANKVARSEADVAAKSQELTEALDRRSNHDQALNDLRAQLADKEAELQTLMSALRPLEQERTQLAEQANHLRREVRTAIDRRSALTSENARLSRAIDDATRDIPDLENQVRTWQSTANALEARLPNDQATFDDAQSKTDRARRNYDEVRRRYDRLVSDAREKGEREGNQDGRREGKEVGEEEGEYYGKRDAEDEGFDNGKSDALSEGKSKGRTDAYPRGYERGYASGLAQGTNSGKHQGLADGKRDGLLDGYNRGYAAGQTRGYDEGIIVGDNQSSYDSGHRTGERSGQLKAIETATAEDYPRGYASALTDLRASPPGTEKDIDLSAPIAIVEHFPQTLSSPQITFTNSPEFTTLEFRSERRDDDSDRRARRNRGHDRDPDGRHRREDQARHQHPDFREAYKRSYDKAYDRSEREGYRRAYDETYDEFYDRYYSGAYTSAYDSHFQSAYNQGYNEGTQSGEQSGFTQGHSVGYGDTYEPSYDEAFEQHKNLRYTEGEFIGYRDGYAEGEIRGNESAYTRGFDAGFESGFDSSIEEERTKAYNNGYADAQVDYRSGNKSEVIKATLKEASGNGTVEEGEAVSLDLSIRNFGDLPNSSDGLKLKLTSKNRNLVLTAPELSLHGITADTLVHFANVIKLSAFQKSSGGIAIDIELWDSSTKLYSNSLTLPFSTPPPSPDPIDILKKGSLWKYFDGNTLSGSWDHLNFSDASWKQGRAPLGYGASVATTISYGGNKRKKHITAWFRQTFDINQKELIQSLELGTSFDDGVVVYLNGKEIARHNMPGGTIHYKTKASKTVGDSDHGKFTKNIIDPQWLLDGKNVLAVELHQRDDDSSDMYFDAYLKLNKRGEP